MRDELTTGEEPMTRDELDSFTRKLEAFSDGLTPKERSLLLQVLMRAGSEDMEDVEAHALSWMSVGAAALALHLRWSKQPPHV
jgi:hypothetical protein